ncbi:hypothetical protein D5S17_11555 [Pseudonocardiaceae bacterium YIM PH 21723]|nr:hypothetical protein D5S17_11555 [Pseudonocardiaceae bacterium YIM PH 21723]
MHEFQGEECVMRTSTRAKAAAVIGAGLLGLTLVAPAYASEQGVAEARQVQDGYRNCLDGGTIPPTVQTCTDSRYQLWYVTGPDKEKAFQNAVTLGCLDGYEPVARVIGCDVSLPGQRWGVGPGIVGSTLQNGANLRYLTSQGVGWPVITDGARGDLGQQWQW